MNSTDPSIKPVSIVDDMSIYLISGRKRSADVHQVLEEARDAERFGFSRVWVSERYDNKEAGTILGAAGGVTSRIGLGTAPIPVGSRPIVLTSTLATSLQAVFERRISLGLGRSISGWIKGHGFNELSYEDLIDYCVILKKLWRGETVNYHGPAGTMENFRLDDIPEGPSPEIVFWHMGGPVASRVAAHPVFDGSGLVECLTAEAVGKSVNWTKEECRKTGRDPETLQFIAGVVTGPDVSEYELLRQVGARLLIFCQGIFLGEYFCERNNWDIKVVERMRSHPFFKDVPSDQWTDHFFQRDEVIHLVEELVPEEWMRTAAAVGTPQQCVRTLEDFKAAGASEIAIYAGSPKVNAGLLEAWRQRTGVVV